MMMIIIIIINNSLFIEGYTANLPWGTHQHVKIIIVKYSLYKSYTQEAKHCSKYTQKDIVYI